MKHPDLQGFDAEEQEEWLDALEGVLKREGVAAASALLSSGLVLSAFGALADFLRLRAGFFAATTFPLSSDAAVFNKLLLAGSAAAADASLSFGTFSAVSGSALVTRRPRSRLVLAFGAASSLAATASLAMPVLAEA